VPLGLVIVILGTLAYTMVGASTSYALLATALFVRGIGFGFTMMPAIAAAYQNLDHAQVPRATATINILQRVGGSIGTALLAVILERQITERLPGATNVITTGGTSISAGVRDRIAPQIAAAFGHTFWWAVGIAVLALVPALFLSRRPVMQVSPATSRPGPSAPELGSKQPSEPMDDRPSEQLDDRPAAGPPIGAASPARRHRNPRHSKPETVNRPGEG
jgi:hypothetical protein